MIWPPSGECSPRRGLEVVEHVYDPFLWARTAFELIEPGGVLIASTPYHGWLKNVLIAATGKFDHHVHPLRTHGHIKFWSMNTLRELLEKTGFRGIRFERVGRFPQLACSMIVFADRPYFASTALCQRLEFVSGCFLMALCLRKCPSRVPAHKPLLHRPWFQNAILWKQSFRVQAGAESM